MRMHSFFRSLFNSFILLSIAGNCYAKTGPFFEVSSTGPVADLNIALALDGNGPLSCQNYTVNGLHLTIRATIPNHTYSFAGIKLLNAPGYTIQGLTLTSDGY